MEENVTVNIVCQELNFEYLIYTFLISRLNPSGHQQCLIKIFLLGSEVVIYLISEYYPELLS